MKRTAGVPTLVLEPTPDILAELVASRPAGQVVVGFAAETSDALREGVRKLEVKGVDLLCVNDVSQPGVGFGHETNALTILDRLGGRQDVARTSKREAADAVLDAVLALSKKTAS
jgi:phosphopantothenoylcysteine decarboxylase/phosphopantothenate--cysteine ligase